MKEELKNVIITFSLIALVFTQGSLMYQKKVLKDYTSKIAQEALVKSNNENIAKIEQNRLLLAKIAQQELANQKAITSQPVETIATNTSNNTNATSNTAQAADLARQQALLAAQQAQALAQAQTVASPSRQSKAS